MVETSCSRKAVFGRAACKTRVNTTRLDIVKNYS